jgi:hypothetical protein
MRCEDYPCCGHEVCPGSGNERTCACCDKPLPTRGRRSFDQYCMTCITTEVDDLENFDRDSEDTW